MLLYDVTCSAVNFATGDLYLQCRTVKDNGLLIITHNTFGKDVNPSL
jgi:hypothetical protein